MIDPEEEVRDAWRDPPDRPRRRNALAAKQSRTRKQPLAATALAPEIVHELERTIPQLQYRDVGGRAHVERPAIVESRKHLRGIAGRTCDYLIERHAKQQELRHHLSLIHI